MDFESPDVMKDFPGLYASDISKKGNNDSDYSDETDKLAKKDLLGKRKDKKDKKDKDRGYAALEGESSAEEIESRSPSKIKKTKAFKFSTKSKEKREKSREKETLEKKKDKEKKSDKKLEKTKSEKKEKKIKTEECTDIAEGLPIFGVPLDVAVERSKCHDGVDIPLPVRVCIDYIQEHGLTMEGVYKISGTKSKVIQIRKLYNQRENVDLKEYDVPIATSLLKMYLRDLPEPIFTNDSLIRFEEAGAILNVGTREKHLRTLTENLPVNNRILLSWLLIHFDNVVLNERHNKMNIQHVVVALSPALHTTNRLLTVLLHHCRALFPTVILDTYVPPLTSTAQLPQCLQGLERELVKQESLLAQIHSEMNAGFISKSREELLWEVQRIITQLKRKIKNLQKEKEPETPVEVKDAEEHVTDSESSQSNQSEVALVNGNSVQKINCKQVLENIEKPFSDQAILFLEFKQKALIELKNRLMKDIEAERAEIAELEQQIQPESQTIPIPIYNNSSNMSEVMDLLHKENQILQINKINLVRNIMEQEEVCIELKAKLGLLRV